MPSKNNGATFGIAGRLMHALQHSNSPKLRKIWKEKLAEKKAADSKKQN